MSDELKRRDFLLLAAASGAAFTGFAGSSDGNPLAGTRQPAVPHWHPPLDGSFADDNATLEEAETDQGGIVRRRPRAVLRPRSVEDVVRIVRYANRNRIAVAPRGRGHSAYGQTLAADGIVIDSSTLDKVVSVSGNAMVVDAGASLETVYRAAYEVGCTLPVTTGCTMLSVGGWIGVGGVGVESPWYGAFTDQVSELQVVTGEGRLVTCSETREPELFEMMLAGMGQCGIIVRATLRLIPAFGQVTWRTMTYEALEPFLDDQRRLAADDRFNSLWSGIFRQQGIWRYRFTVGRFGRNGEDTDPLALMEPVSRGRVSDPVRRTYAEIAAATFGRPLPAGARTGQSSSPARAPAGSTLVSRPALALYVPASAARDIIAPLLASRSDSAGITTIECVAQNTQRFRRQLFRLPNEEQIFTCWILRTAYRDSGPGLAEQLEANARFLERAVALGAKRYPPFGGVTTPADWRVHYGENLYRRFAAAKRKYDERSILSPGAGIFG